MNLCRVHPRPSLLALRRPPAGRPRDTKEAGRCRDRDRPAARQAIRRAEGSGRLGSHRLLGLLRLRRSERAELSCWAWRPRSPGQDGGGRRAGTIPLGFITDLIRPSASSATIAAPPPSPRIGYPHFRAHLPPGHRGGSGGWTACGDLPPTRRSPDKNNMGLARGHPPSSNALPSAARNHRRLTAISSSTPGTSPPCQTQGPRHQRMPFQSEVG